MGEKASKILQEVGEGGGGDRGGILLNLAAISNPARITEISIQKKIAEWVYKKLGTCENINCISIIACKGIQKKLF